MSENLLRSRERRLLRLTLNRPGKRNALDAALCIEIVEAVREAEEDRSIGAILLDAAGPAFCSGMDLDESLLPDAAARTAVHERLFTIGAEARKPLVAAVQGPALAGGTGLVANAHVVYAAEEATLGLTEIRIGMWPLVVGRALCRAVGERRTLEMSLTGRIFGAAEALQYGLVHFVVTAAELNARAAAAAAAIAAASAAALAAGMQYFRQCRGLSWERRGELAGSLRAGLFAGADYAEGVRAFREKRPPCWPSAGGPAEKEGSHER